MRADGPALPRPAVVRSAAALVLVGLTFSGACQAADPVKGEATFSAAGGYARLVLRLAEDVEFRSDHRRLDSRDPVQAPGGHSDRQIVRGRARLYRLGAARSRRHGDPAVVGAQGDHQHHDRRRTGVRRFSARHLDRSAAQPSAGSGARTGRARARRRARTCACSARQPRPRSVRRSACAPRCSRPSSASCSKCPTASASPRC